MRAPVPPVKERCDSDSSWAPSWPISTTLAEPSRRPRKNIGPWCQRNASRPTTDRPRPR